MAPVPVPPGAVPVDAIIANLLCQRCMYLKRRFFQALRSPRRKSRFEIRFRDPRPASGGDSTGYYLAHEFRRGGLWLPVRHYLATDDLDWAEVRTERLLRRLHARFPVIPFHGGKPSLRPELLDRRFHRKDLDIDPASFVVKLPDGTFKARVPEAGKRFDPPARATADEALDDALFASAVSRDTPHKCRFCRKRPRAGDDGSLVHSTPGCPCRVNLPGGVITREMATRWWNEDLLLRKHLNLGDRPLDALDMIRLGVVGSRWKPEENFIVWE